MKKKFELIADFPSNLLFICGVSLSRLESTQQQVEKLSTQLTFFSL